MTDIAEARKLVTYCGGFCGSCAMFKGRIIAMVAQDFKELTTGYEEWLPKVMQLNFDYDSFAKGLEYFCQARSSCYCQISCKQGGGAPCKIRPCAKERGVEICFECNDFPCQHFDWLIEKYPKIQEEQRRYKKLGFEKWLRAYVGRAKKGYANSTRKYYSKARKE